MMAIEMLRSTMKPIGMYNTDLDWRFLKVTLSSPVHLQIWKGKEVDRDCLVSYQDGSRNHF